MRRFEHLELPWHVQRTRGATNWRAGAGNAVLARNPSSCKLSFESFPEALLHTESRLIEVEDCLFLLAFGLVFLA